MQFVFWKVAFLDFERYISYCTFRTVLYQPSISFDMKKMKIRSAVLKYLWISWHHSQRSHCILSLRYNFWLLPMIGFLWKQLDIYRNLMNDNAKTHILCVYIYIFKIIIALFILICNWRFHSWYFAAFVDIWCNRHWFSALDILNVSYRTKPFLNFMNHDILFIMQWLQ